MRIGIHLVLLLFASSTLFAQYTDQINSNRPGESIGAFSVGTGVIQFEAGGEYRFYKHKGYNNSTINGNIGFFSLRWGFLKEQLELTYEGSYLLDKLTSAIVTPNPIYKQDGFLRNFIGVKYLVYDPFKKEEINVYSWDDNNLFRIRDLIPAVSLTIGANFNPNQNDQAFPYGDVFNIIHAPILYQNIGGRRIIEPLLCYRATLATQSHFLGTWVFVTNFSYDRITSDFPEKSYILTLTHTFSPKWSVYMENQGIYSEVYVDQIFRTGAAFLLTDDIQIEGSIGANTKDTPALFSMNAGISYRLDFHKDKDKAGIQSEKERKKALKNERKGLGKQAKKASKSQRKSQRKARKN